MYYYKSMIFALAAYSFCEFLIQYRGYAICNQQRRRSACASAQSDQRLCCLLPGSYNTSSFYIRNFKSLAIFWSWAGWFESYLAKNPDTFLRDVDHMQMTKMQIRLSIHNSLISAIVVHCLDSIIPLDPKFQDSSKIRIFCYLIDVINFLTS